MPAADMIRLRDRRHTRYIMGLLCVGLVLAGCSGDAQSAEQPSAAPSPTVETQDQAAASATSGSEAPSAAGSGSDEPTAPAARSVSTETVDPANFDDPATGRNPYLPLVPGTQSVREGSTRIGGRTVPHQVTTTITDVYREIAGVRTVAVLDSEIDSGQVTEISVDYMAEDKAGNVWLMGSYTEKYEGGQFVAALDGWMHGTNDAEAGVLVQADPKVDTPPYSVAKTRDEADEVAQVVDVGTEHCVPFDCFNDALVVREGRASAPDNEFKIYARDVGQIDNVPRRDSRGKDVEPLINLSMLSPEALTESSKEALRLDHNAPEQVPAVFGGKPLAERAAQ